MLIFTLSVKSNSQFIAVLSEVRKHSDVRYGMLRVASSETSGRIFIVDGAFIIGCELSDGRKGALALTTLLSVERAIVGFLEMPRRTGGGGVAVNIESMVNDCNASAEENVGNVLRRILNQAPVTDLPSGADAPKQPAPHSLMMHVVHNQVRKELGPSRDATSSGAAATLTEIVLRNLDTYNKLLQRLDRAPDKNFISRSELLCADIAMFESLLEASHRNTYAAQSVKRLRQTLLKLIKRARAQPLDYEPAAALVQTPPPKPIGAPSQDEREEENITPAGIFNNLASTLQHDISKLPDSEAAYTQQQEEEAPAAATAPSYSKVVTSDTGSIRVFATDTDFEDGGLMGSGGAFSDSDTWEYGSDDPFDWGESLFLSEEESAAAQGEAEEAEQPDRSYKLEAVPENAARIMSAAAAMSAVPPSPDFAPDVPLSPPPPPSASTSGTHARVSSSTEIPENLRYPHAGLSGGLAHEHDVKDKPTDSSFRRELKNTDSLAKKRIEKHAKSKDTRGFVVGIAVLAMLSVGGYFGYVYYLAPPTPKQLYDRALLAEQQKYYLRAREQVDKSIEQAPNFAPAYLLRARLHTSNGEYADALADYKRATQLGSSDDESILKAQAEVAFKADAWAEAQDALQKLLEKSPDDLELHQKLAMTYLRLDKSKMSADEVKAALQQAIEHYTRAITGGAAEPGTIYRSRGVVYEELQDYPKATADYSEAIKLNPQDQLAFSRRGSLYLRNGDADKAFADLSKAAEKAPNPEALVDLASIYEKKGDHAKAGDLAARALELNSKNVGALVIRANSYLAQKAFPRALDDYDAAMELEPNNATVRALREKALSAYRAASPSAVRELGSVEQPGKLPPIPKNMPEGSLILKGYEQLRDGHTDVAIQMLTEALNKEPSNETARRYLAHAYFRAHHPAQSAQQFKSVAGTAELTEADQIVYGDALSQTNQTTEAIDVLNTCVANRPTSVAARVLLARCLLKTGDRTKAQQVVNDGLQLTSDPDEKRELNAVLTNDAGGALSPKPDTTSNSNNSNPNNNSATP